MQGLGNDFVVLDGPVSLTPQEIDELCDRRFGIGADGVLAVTKEDPIRMDYWNADGSAAEMCGNGLRCVARYVYDRGWAPDRNFTILTPIGVRGVNVHDDVVEAELGRPRRDGSRSIDGADYELVDVGNPHAVRFVDDPAAVDVKGIGSGLQSRFDDGANIEFVAVNGSDLDMRVFERGVGETMACGTGMAAAATVVAERDELKGPIMISVPGGQATVELRDGVAWIVGPAEYSFRGSVGER